MGFLSILRYARFGALFAFYKKIPKKSLGVVVLKVEVRKMFRSNGLIDDVVVLGRPQDYVQFAEVVETAVSSSVAVVFAINLPFSIEVRMDNSVEELFTSLQNKDNKYFSIAEWNERNILRVVGSKNVLRQFNEFLRKMALKEEGYGYISQFSNICEYSVFSPEWRLHVQNV